MDDAIKNWMQDWVNRVNVSNSQNVFKKAFTENSNEIRFYDPLDNSLLKP